MALARARRLSIAPNAPKPGRTPVAELCQALSDETRLAILELLCDGERCVCELTDALGAAQPRLSFHLRVLKDAGLVSDRRDGRWIYYTTVPDALTALNGALAALTPVTTFAGARRRPLRRAECCR
jgi:ArsR family transcriptional regulator